MSDVNRYVPPLQWSRSSLTCIYFATKGISVILPPMVRCTRYNLIRYILQGTDIYYGYRYGLCSYDFYIILCNCYDRVVFVYVFHITESIPTIYSYMHILLAQNKLLLLSNGFKFKKEIGIFQRLLHNFSSLLIFLVDRVYSNNRHNVVMTSPYRITFIQTLYVIQEVKSPDVLYNLSLIPFHGKELSLDLQYWFLMNTNF